MDELIELLRDNFSPHCIARVIGELQTSRDGEVKSFKDMLVEILGGIEGYNILINEIES